ncbi:MAG: AgmX/PglI C-terminal domain-containing protein [Polyangiaceae bacterium]|nr:AgmX/PglI C-terminal domain-containing protein [Polyangiaceae bacterium]
MPRRAFRALVLASLAGFGCGPAQTNSPQAQPGASTAGTANAAPSSDASAPNGAAGTTNAAGLPRVECDRFMDVVARTTTLRASIHREVSSLARATEWADAAMVLSADAKALVVTHPDLVIETANLATRLSDLGRQLKTLVAAEKGSDSSKKAAAHTLVIQTSEQVEVLTREPAARCAGNTKKLLATSGKLPIDAVQRALQAQFPQAQKCYEEGLKRNKKLEGRVLVRLVVGLSGAATEAAAVSGKAAEQADIVTPSSVEAPALADEKVVACVVAAMAAAKFPPPDGGTVSIVYPVTFSRSP